MKITMLPKSAFVMLGTERTGEYNVALRTSTGQVGYRALTAGQFRLRVEPASEAASLFLTGSLTRETGFRQPGDGGENRFSTVIFGGESGLRQNLAPIFALLLAGVSEAEANKDDILSGVTDAVEAAQKVSPHYRAALIDELRTAKVPGANAASRWSTDTLAVKVKVLRASKS